jgi:hypothetical protein
MRKRHKLPSFMIPTACVNNAGPAISSNRRCYFGASIVKAEENFRKHIKVSFLSIN